MSLQREPLTFLGMTNSDGPNFFVSVPHAGEQVPDDVLWLKGLPEATLMRDVDRFVDGIYEPVTTELGIPFVVTPWHRYVVDLNRFPTDFDQQSVEGAVEVVGTHPKGLHWSVTTHGEPLILQPMSSAQHQHLVETYYKPFHKKVRELRQSLKDGGPAHIYHLDAHSMPSVGTDFHKDPGERRADIVVSDYHGATCSEAFRNLVLKAYQEVGFQVAYNYPYVGGGITRMLGEPKAGFHNIQVEINRDLYMNEATKQKDPKKFEILQKQVRGAVEVLYNELKDWK